MPWSVLRCGAEVHVRILPPVDDWEELMDTIFRSLDPMPTSVHLPKTFEHVSTTEQELLDLLRSTLRAEGAPIA